MPSYYDSKASKPGKAKRKYDDDADIEEVVVNRKRGERPPEGWSQKDAAAQRAKVRRENQAIAKKRGVKDYTDLEFYNKEKKQGAARKRLQASYAGGGKVTYARGSGAARPQIFRKNG